MSVRACLLHHPPRSSLMHPSAGVSYRPVTAKFHFDTIIYLLQSQNSICARVQIQWARYETYITAQLRSCSFIDVTRMGLFTSRNAFIPIYKGFKKFSKYFRITTTILVASRVTWESTNVERLRTKRSLPGRPRSGCLCTPGWNCHDFTSIKMYASSGRGLLNHFCLVLWRCLVRPSVNVRVYFSSRFVILPSAPA